MQNTHEDTTDRIADTLPLKRRNKDSDIVKSIEATNQNTKTKRGPKSLNIHPRRKQEARRVIKNNES